MKSNFKKFAVAIAAIMTICSLALISCSKDKTTLMREQNRMYDAEALSGNSINSKMPNIPMYFDQVGIKHNEYLDSIGVALRDTLLYYEQSGHTLAEFGKDTFDIIIDRVKSLYQADVHDIFLLARYNFEHDIWAPTQDIIEHNGLDFFEENFGLRLQSIIGMVDETVSIDSMRVQIRTIEYAVIQDAKCKEDTAIAFALSIWEHSLDYWSNALSDVTNPWYGFGDDMNSSKTRGSLSSQKGLFSGLKAFVTNVVNAVRNLFNPQSNDNPIPAIVLCDLAGGAAMAHNGTALLSVHPLVYGTAIVVSGALTSAGSYFLNKK